jgi:aminoglycoside phosphotransferase (APT) family kinase protein
LSNPESRWEPVRTAQVDVAEAVRARLGDIPGTVERLGGGLANDSIRVGDRVLRIYRRDVESLAREAALLERSWQHVRVPQVVERGDDFLLLEFVEHTPLSSAPEQAAAVGRALAEIHRDRFEDAGFLAAQARRVARPFGDFVDAFCAHVESLESVPADISAAIVARFEAKRAVLAGLADRPVLLHGDFKVSNIHWTEEGRPLVLDWEFAYAGPALLDVGQILRWEVPDAWVATFAGAYGAAGGELPDDWRALARTLDLVNLAGLLDGAAHGSRRREDVLGRLRQSL